MTGANEGDIGFEDARKAGQDLAKSAKQLFSNFVLAMRNAINRQRWYVRGVIKSGIAWGFIQLTIELLSFISDFVKFSTLLSSYEILISLLPSFEISIIQIFVFFIGLFILFESIQLRRLGRIESLVESSYAPKSGGEQEDELQSDGGTREDLGDGDSSSTGGGTIGGAIAGGAVGSAFGPQGALLGAVAGALLGNELEKSRTEKELPELQCRLLNYLISHHAWNQTVPKDKALRHAGIPPEDRRKAAQAWEELGFRVFILASERGYRLDPHNFDQLANYLYEKCGWSEQQIRTRLQHLDQWE